ncbi:hypothetical protein SAY86_029310 [Trapa natans]|uniref:BTB domain-containing protein n=1 Tax=Trapa natans TaxID=22666 RepID=A0AAN7R9H2_TRANT|nr:hypothetical protein SAY86_029310 [Trapa natans]
MRKGRQLFLYDVTLISRTEAAIRAVLMMIFSPCKFIASTARSILSVVLETHSEEYLEYSIHMIRSKSTRENLMMLELLQLVIHLMSLTCYLALPLYQSFIARKGASTMIDFVKRCFSRPYSLARKKYAVHIVNNFNERACCWAFSEDWEGRDILVFYGLWGLAKLIHHCEAKDLLALHKEETGGQLFTKLSEICSDPSVGGARWFAAYILTYFGLFGFPSKFGEMVGKARRCDDFVDIQLTLADGEKLSVHRSVLIARCPSLLPPKDSPPTDSYSVASMDSEEPCGKSCRELNLSSLVGHSELEKVLDYVYMGCLHTEEDMLKSLKPLSQSCGLQPLTYLLSKRIPKWGMPVPNFDLSPALGLGGQRFSDIILESKTADLVNWTCTLCSSLVPHVHLHRVILCASCDYFRAMLQSGMLESHSQVVKVPISWAALQKLVKWFYSFELPRPPFDCVWQNMGTEDKLKNLEPFIELSWLSEFWFLDELHEECSRTILPCLDSDSKLSVKALQHAADLSQWKIVEAAADRAAGSFRQLNEAGALESLDDALVEMVRAASVRLSQAGSEGPCE